MKPIQITLGILIRTLVSIFLVAYFHIAIATALIPNLQIGAIISTIASIIVTAALVTTVVRFQPDNRARYALASLYANGSMALCLIGHLVFSFKLSADHIMGILLARSEEHTSELQSLIRTSYAVFCLNTKIQHNHITHTKMHDDSVIY